MYVYSFHDADAGGWKRIVFCLTTWYFIYLSGVEILLKAIGAQTTLL